MRGNFAVAPIKFSDGANSPLWLNVGGVKDKVLTVTVDFSVSKDGADYKLSSAPRTATTGCAGPKPSASGEG